MTPTTSSPTPASVYFNLELTSTFTGYLQHVVWEQNSGVLTNLTSCAAGYSTDTSFLMQLFSSRIKDYTSRLRIVNTSAGMDHAILVFYDQASGAEIMRWQSPDVVGGATLELSVPAIEAATTSLGGRPDTLSPLYNVKVLPFNGYVQHVLQGRVANGLFDMTAKCDLVAAK